MVARFIIYKAVESSNTRTVHGSDSSDYKYIRTVGTKLEIQDQEVPYQMKMINTSGPKNDRPCRSLALTTSIQPMNTTISTRLRRRSKNCSSGYKQRSGKEASAPANVAPKLKRSPSLDSSSRAVSRRAADGQTAGESKSTLLHSSCTALLQTHGAFHCFCIPMT